MQYFLITLKQVCLMILYILVGILLRKTGKLGKEASKVLATLMIYFIGPCYTLINMTENFSLDLISQYAEMFLTGIVVLVLCILLSFVFTRFFAKEGYIKNVYRYMFAFANIGFFGNPLVEAVFGGEILVQYMIFSLPMNIALASYGFVILTDNGVEKTREEKKKHLIKVLTTPSLLAMIGSLILCLCSVKLPDIVKFVLQPASKCYSAIPMILLGCVLGNFELKALVTYPKAYFASLVRLIVIPAIFVGVAMLAHLLGTGDHACVLIVLLSALPAGMNVVTYPESFGMDGSLGAKLIFLSYVFSMVTIPLAIMTITGILGI